MKIRKTEFVISAVSRKQYPAEGLPEVAFAGRSNVGKSSLINCLLNRRNFARISSQPGKTRTINFYRINDSFILADLPGYGYARVSKAEKQKWGKMMEEYLNTRTTLEGILHLIDMRHKPTELDVMMYDWIKQMGFLGIVIATKADKISRGKWKNHLRDIENTLRMDENDIIIPFSAVKREGKEDVWDIINQLISSVLTHEIVYKSSNGLKLEFLSFHL